MKKEVKKENKVETMEVYLMYNKNDNSYYDDGGYMCEFEEAYVFTSLDEISNMISDNLVDLTDDELEEIEIQKFECKLSEVLKRKIVYEPVKE